MKNEWKSSAQVPRKSSSESQVMDEGKKEKENEVLRGRKFVTRSERCTDRRRRGEKKGVVVERTDYMDTHGHSTATFGQRKYEFPLLRRQVRLTSFERESPVQQCLCKFAGQNVG